MLTTILPSNLDNNVDNNLDDNLYNKLDNNNDNNLDKNLDNNLESNLENMPKVCLRNAQDMPRYAKDMPLICPRYTLPLNILTTDLEKTLELCKRF